MDIFIFWACFSGVGKGWFLHMKSPCEGGELPWGFKHWLSHTGDCNLLVNFLWLLVHNTVLILIYFGVEVKAYPWLVKRPSYIAKVKTKQRGGLHKMAAFFRKEKQSAKGRDLNGSEESILSAKEVSIEKMAIDVVYEVYWMNVDAHVKSPSLNGFKELRNRKNLLIVIHESGTLSINGLQRTVKNFLCFMGKT